MKMSHQQFKEGNQKRWNKNRGRRSKLLKFLL